MSNALFPSSFLDRFWRNYQASVTPLSALEAVADFLYNHPLAVGDKAFLYCSCSAFNQEVEVTSVDGHRVGIRLTRSDNYLFTAHFPAPVAGTVTKRPNDNMCVVTTTGQFSAYMDRQYQQDILLHWYGGERRAMRSQTGTYYHRVYYCTTILLSGGEGDPLPDENTPVQIIVQARCRLQPYSGPLTGPWRVDRGQWTAKNDRGSSPNVAGLITSDTDALVTLRTSVDEPGHFVQANVLRVPGGRQRIHWGKYCVEYIQGEGTASSHFAVILYGPDGAVIGGYASCDQYQIAGNDVLYFAAWQESSDDVVNLEAGWLANVPNGWNSYSADRPQRIGQIAADEFSGGEFALAADCPGDPIGFANFSTGRVQPTDWPPADGCPSGRRACQLARRSETPYHYAVRLDGLNDGPYPFDSAVTVLASQLNGATASATLCPYLADFWANTMPAAFWSLPSELLWYGGSTVWSIGSQFQGFGLTQDSSSGRYAMQASLMLRLPAKRKSSVTFSFVPGGSSQGALCRASSSEPLKVAYNGAQFSRTDSSPPAPGQWRWADGDLDVNVGDLFIDVTIYTSGGTINTQVNVGTGQTTFSLSIAQQPIQVWQGNSMLSPSSSGNPGTYWWSSGTLSLVPYLDRVTTTADVTLPTSVQGVWKLAADLGPGTFRRAVAEKPAKVYYDTNQLWSTPRELTWSDADVPPMNGWHWANGMLVVNLGIVMTSPDGFLVIQTTKGNVVEIDMNPDVPDLRAVGDITLADTGTGVTWNEAGSQSCSASALWGNLSFLCAPVFDRPAFEWRTPHWDLGKPFPQKMRVTISGLEDVVKTGTLASEYGYLPDLTFTYTYRLSQLNDDGVVDFMSASYIVNYHRTDGTVLSPVIGEPYYVENQGVGLLLAGANTPYGAFMGITDSPMVGVARVIFYKVIQVEVVSDPPGYESHAGGNVSGYLGTRLHLVFERACDDNVADLSDFSLSLVLGTFDPYGYAKGGTVSASCKISAIPDEQ